MGNKADRKLIASAIQWLVKDRFPFLSVEIADDRLKIGGNFFDPDWIHTYTVQIFHKLASTPKVYVITPEIKPSPKIHMYNDKSLCLFFPADLPKGYQFTIGLDIIPWTIKWLHYYEIFLRNGNHWVGPEAPHGTF